MWLVTSRSCFYTLVGKEPLIHFIECSFIIYFNINTRVGLPIEILVDDTVTSRTRFCIGERLTLICNGNSGSYIWRIPPLLVGNQVLISIGVMSVTINNFAATFISMTESRLQFNVSSELNDTTITCFDPNLSQEISTLTLLLLGKMFIEVDYFIEG